MDASALSETEVRVLIADAGGKLHSWMYNKDVCTNQLIRETVQRMNELAATLPTSP